MYMCMYKHQPFQCQVCTVVVWCFRSHDYLSHHSLQGHLPQMVIVEAVGLVPQAGILIPLSAEVVNGLHDSHQVIQILTCHVLVAGIMASDLQGNIQHYGSIEGHLSSAISLLQCATSWEGARAIKYT